MWYFIGCILSLILTILLLIEDNKNDDQELWEKIIFYPIGILVLTCYSWLGVLIVLLNFKYKSKYYFTYAESK